MLQWNENYQKIPQCWTEKRVCISMALKYIQLVHLESSGHKVH